MSKLKDKLKSMLPKAPVPEELDSDVVGTTVKDKETKTEETIRLEADVAAYEKYRGVIPSEDPIKSEIACLLFAVFSELRALRENRKK